MEWIQEKWGGREHRRGDIRVLGDDRHGRWAWGVKGRTIRRDGEVLWVAEHDVLFLLRDGWWSASWWPDHPEVSVYVDIATAPVWHEHHVVTVDLDLDVIRFCDGRTEIVDRDEFELHQRELGYPAAVVEAAERAAGEVLDLVVSGAAPFDGATARRWLGAARRDGRRALEEPHPSRLDHRRDDHDAILRAHATAMATGADRYVDPTTGLLVFTAAFLAGQGTCCETGCRHCPYIA